MAVSFRSAYHHRHCRRHPDHAGADLALTVAAYADQIWLDILVIVLGIAWAMMSMML
jgi:hypothetical protein